MSFESLPERCDERDAWLQPHLTPAIAPESVDWSRVRNATYRIDQRFCYTYPSPIRNLRHRLVLSPPRRHGAQERLARKLTFTPAFGSARDFDAFGNEVVTLAIPRVERAFEVTFASLVRTHAAGAADAVRAPGGPSAATHDGPFDDAAPFSLGLHMPSHLTACDDAMREAAFELQRAYRDECDRARAISQFAFERIAYTKDVTDVTTTAIRAFHLRRGVCQDFAHVALALARSAGLACRYVMGHLLGEGGTHAWVEFLIPDANGRTRVLALDPTHDRAVTMRYVVVAVGRDYDDVAPTSGSFEASFAGTYTSRHAVTIARVDYA